MERIETSSLDSGSQKRNKKKRNSWDSHKEVNAHSAKIKLVYDTNSAEKCLIKKKNKNKKTAETLQKLVPTVISTL